MVAYTNDDLVNRVLTQLGEVGFGESPEEEARGRVVDAMPGILDELRELGVYVLGGSTIPGAALDPLSVIVASRLGAIFNLSIDDQTTLAQRVQGAGDRLLRMKFQGFAARRARVEYF